MRWMIMHKTEPKWEAGEPPSRELVAKVGALIGELAKANAFGGGDGLRASSLGVRLRFEGGRRTAIPGPFAGENELPAGMLQVRTKSLEEAAGWANRLAEVVGDLEVDIRPLTEGWDIGLATRPEGLATTRYMLLYKADAASEAGAPMAPEKRAHLRRLTGEMSRAGVLLVQERLEPSAKGKRIRFRGGKKQIIDGPFTESKELIAGYVIVSADSLDAAMAWADRYGTAVECEELDVRLMAEPEPP
jgi:hypothetical protein